MPPRVGIVGISGYYAFAFAEALWGNHGVEFVAASSWPPEEERGVSAGQIPPRGGASRRMSLEEYGRHFEVRMYDDPVAMIKRESLDGVCICGNTDDHLDQVEAIAPTGVHMFFHKPVCDKLVDIDPILGIIRKHGIKTGACNPARYDDAIRGAKALIDAGDLGDVMSVRAYLSHSGTLKSRAPVGLEMRGPEVHLGFYTADLTQWFMDWAEVESAFAHYAKLNPHDAQPQDSAKGLIKFKDGRIGSMDLYCSPQWPGPLWEIEVMGTAGFVRTSQSAGQGTLFTKDGVHGFQHDHQHAGRVHVNELDAWVTAVRDGVDCELSAELAARGVELCLAWKQSSDENRPVSLPLERRF